MFDKYDNAPKAQAKNKVENLTDQKIESKKVEKKVVEPIKTTDTSQKQPEITPSGADNDLKKMQEYFQKCPESYNGAIRDKYSWSQSIKDVDVKVKVFNNIQI